MDFELREASPEAIVLTCRGSLSWQQRDQLAANVADYLAPRQSMRGLVLDMGAVDFVNSAGLGALFQVAREVRSRGGEVVFANVTPIIHRLLTTVGMLRVAHCERDVDDAVDRLRQAGPAPVTSHPPSEP